MRTRIRHFRKQRGLTQTELAMRLGTTAATVSRLETADMTVSTGWLERIAGELDVPVTDLLDAPSKEALACIGNVERDGRVIALAGPVFPSASLHSRAREPMLFRMGETLGPYAKGDLLIADCLSAAQAGCAIGRDCFAGSAESGFRFGRLISLAADACILMPPEAGAPPCEVASPNWIAPVVTLIRNYPPLKIASADF